MKSLKLMSLFAVAAISLTTLTAGAIEREGGRMQKPLRTEIVRPEFLTGMLLTHPSFLAALQKANQAERGGAVIDRISIATFPGNDAKDPTLEQSNVCVTVDFFGGDVFGPLGIITGTIESRRQGRGRSLEFHDVEFRAVPLDGSIGCEF